MPSTTPLRDRPYPLETDTPDVAADIERLALNLDSSPVVGQGTLASRPAGGVPGNRFYVSGDSNSSNNGIEWYDTGSGWIPIAYSNTERQSNKGVASGYCDLDAGGHVPLSRLSGLTAAQFAPTAASVCVANGGQSIGSGWSAVYTSTVINDPGSNLSGNGTYLTYKVPATGVYLLSGLVSTVAEDSPPQEFGIGFCVNATDSGSGGNSPNLPFYIQFFDNVSGGNPWGVPLTVAVPLTEGQFINLCAYSNGTLTLGGDAQQTQMAIFRVA